MSWSCRFRREPPAADLAQVPATVLAVRAALAGIQSVTQLSYDCHGTVVLMSRGQKKHAPVF